MSKNQTERDAYADEIHACRIIDHDDTECYEVTGIHLRSNNSIFAERIWLRIHLTRADAKALKTWLEGLLEEASH